MLFPSCSASVRFVQRSNCECAYHSPLVFRGTACITRRLCSGSSKISGLVNTCIIQDSAEQKLFGIARLYGRWPNIGQSNAGVGDLASLIQANISSYSGNTIITNLALKLKMRSAASFGRCGNTNLG